MKITTRSRPKTGRRYTRAPQVQSVSNKFGANGVRAIILPMNLQSFVKQADITDEWTSLNRLIRRRRSIRRYTDQSIPQALLLELLEAASWAPSAHNRQPWRFCLVTSSEGKMRLSMAMGNQWRADLGADNADPEFIERRVAISHARMTSASALVIASLTMIDMDQYPDPTRAKAEWAMTVQSVALACQNLLLAAEAHGIGACWMCAPLFVPELVRRELELPDDWEPQALITLGYPAESKQKERAPLESHLVWR